MKEKELQKLVNIHKSFASAPRLRILFALLEKELTVTELIEVCNLTQSATSHQLKGLKKHKLVKARKDGLNVYYSLDDSHVSDILMTSLTHVKHI